MLDDEERRARRQARALRKVRSAECLLQTQESRRKRSSGILTKKFFEKENISALASPCQVDLAHETVEDQEEATIESPVFAPIESMHELKPDADVPDHSKESHDSEDNANKEPSDQIGLQERRESKDSALIKFILTERLEDGLPRRYSSAVQSVRTRLASLLDGFDPSVPAGDVLEPSKYLGDGEKAQIVTLIERYRFLRQFSLSDKDVEKPMILGLVQELDRIVNGIEADQAEGTLEDIDFTLPAVDLMSPVEGEEPLVVKSQVLCRDLSHELLGKAASRVNVLGDESDEFTNLVKKKFVNESPIALQLAEEEMIRVEGLSDDPFFVQILEKYRACMQSGRTALMQSPPELSALFAKIIRQELDPVRDTQDPKHLLLVPLNEAGVQRWVPPGAKFRLGRHSTVLREASLVVSRNHAEIMHDGIDSFLVMDIGSSSGTYVNGERLSESNQQSGLRGLASGDILQLGVDFEGEADELGNIPSQHRSVQLLVLLGHPRKASAPLLTETFTMPRKTPTKDDLISHQRIQKMTQRALSAAGRLAGSNARIYLEMGDLIHCGGAGNAVIISGDRMVYAAIFNNYKMNWEMAVADSEGIKTLTLEALANSATTYGVRLGNRELARLTAITPEKMTVDMLPRHRPQERPLPDLNFILGRSMATLNESPAIMAEEAVGLYSITGSIHDGLFCFIERSRVDRQQIFLGEALMGMQRTGWMANKKRVLIEMRLVIAERDEQIMLMAALLMSLLQLEQGPRKRL